MEVPIEHYLIFSFLLFSIGVAGVLIRRNAIVILMSIELILNSANINLIAFSDKLAEPTGQVFAVFTITIAAAEAAVGLAILIALFKNRQVINVDEIDILKW